MGTATGEKGLMLTFARPLVRSLTRHGVSPDEFLASIGVPAEGTPDGKVSIDLIHDALVRLAEERNIAHLDLDLGKAMPVGVLGRTDYTFAASSTLFHAMMRSQSHVASFTEALQIELHIDDGVYARLQLVQLAPTHQPLFDVVTVVIVAARIRHVLGENIPFSAVRFRHQSKGPTEPYDEFFGTHVEFGAAESALLFPAPLLQEELLTADPSLAQLLRDQKAAAQKKEVEQADDLLVRARAQLRQALEKREDPPTIVTLARDIGMATRSLQRKLGERDTSFSTLFDEVRRDLATTLLERENVLLVDVAAHLGFQNLNAFHRAFRRWTGVSPRAFQKKLVGS